MSAPYSNNNASKWDLEQVGAILKEIEATSRSTEMPHLGLVLADLRISRTTWAYWKKKFAVWPGITDQMTLIEQIIDGRQFAGVASGKLKAGPVLLSMRMAQNKNNAAEPASFKHARPLGGFYHQPTNMPGNDYGTKPDEQQPELPPSVTLPPLIS